MNFWINRKIFLPVLLVAAGGLQAQTSNYNYQIVSTMPTQTGGLTLQQFTALYPGYPGNASFGALYPLTNYGSMPVNSGGQTAFWADSLLPSGLGKVISGNKIVATAAGPAAARDQDIYSYIPGFYQTAMNDLGQVAYIAWGGPGRKPGVWLDNLLIAQMTQTVGGCFLKPPEFSSDFAKVFTGKIGIDNAGQVYFEARCFFIVGGEFGDYRTLIIRASPGSALPLQIRTTTLPTATAGQPYSAALTASGGTTSGYSWSLFSGALPIGFTLSPGGVLSSTGAPVAAAQTYPFTVKVTDSANNSTTQALSLVVQRGIQITTTTLPNGVVGSAFDSGALVATGGSGAFTWTKVSGTLPTGYDLLPTGKISAPSVNSAAAGKYQFRLRATDLNNDKAFGEADLTLYVVGQAELLDPIPTPPAISTSLLVGSQITSDRQTLSSGGRRVKGIAADGVTRLVIRVPVLSPGDAVSARLLTDQCRDLSKSSQCPSSQSPNDDGQLFAVVPGNSASGGSPYEFFGYKAPIDFVRQSVTADTTSATRPAYVRLGYSNSSGEYASQVVPFTIVRPPLFLVHGFNTDANQAWAKFRLPNANVYQIYLIDYGQRLFGLTYSIQYDPDIETYTAIPSYFPMFPDLDIVSTTPEISQSRLHLALRSHLGIEVNTPFIIPQFESRLTRFKSGENPANLQVAAVQSDVVAHSMGGLLIRNWVTNTSSYVSDRNFREGALHKVISLGTPYWGTPQAVLVLTDQAQCSRKLATFFNSLSFLSVNVRGNSQPLSGATGDLRGNGLGTAAMSEVLTRMAQSTRRVPLAVVAGEVSAIEDKLDINRSSTGLFFCGSDPLASRQRDSAMFATVFDPNIFDSTTRTGSSVRTASDGSVPRTSALMDSTVTYSTRCQGNCFQSHAHSGGIADLFGTGVQHLQNSPTVATYVGNLLNTPVTSLVFGARQ